MRNDRGNLKYVCMIFELSVKGGDVKELKFRTAVSGISRSGVGWN